MKLTQEEFGKLTAEDQENYRALHGESFEHPLLNKPATSGAASEEELKTEAFWHHREARQTGMRMLATPGQEATGRALLKASDNAAAFWVVVTVIIFGLIVWFFSRG